jgi:hypothetical protein
MSVGQRWQLCVLVALIGLFNSTSTTHAYVLVADRPTNRILKYSDGGQFLGVVVDDATNLGGPGNAGGPNSLALSPDRTKLYVSSLNSNVVRYDFNGTTGANPAIYSSNGASTIVGPGGLLLSPNGNTLYVANRGLGNLTTVAQLNAANGTSAGADLTGGPTTGRTGLAFNPGGTLLVGAFGTNFAPGGAPGGGVLRYDSGANSFVDLVPQSNLLAGVGGILVHNNDLYVTASVSADFGGRVGKYNATTGAPDVTFGTGGLLTPEVSFPASITETADGTGFLLGMLHIQTTGAGRVDRYLYNGTRVGVWANNSNANPALGFVEATALLEVVPEPATFGGAALAAVALGALRRATKRRR